MRPATRTGGGRLRLTSRGTLWRSWRDDQNPTAHASDHQNGGGDEISVAGLSGMLADAQLVGVRKNSTGSTFTRQRLNFIEGSNVTLTVADDGGNGEVDITIESTGAGVAEWIRDRRTHGRRHGRAGIGEPSRDHPE